MSLDTRGEDSLILNTKDESFKVLTLRDVTNNKYHGKFMHGLSMECMSCCQFSYNIQLHMDIIKRKIVGIFLNSENISIEDHGMIHEIKNIYATDETFYACFPKDGTDKRIILPLIPLDLKYPQNTINRIKSLLIFS